MTSTVAYYASVIRECSFQENLGSSSPSDGGRGTLRVGTSESPRCIPRMLRVKGAFMELRKFQQEFIRRAFAPGIDIAALSLPRGNGKSFLAAHIVTRALTPGDDLFVDGKEIVQCAGSIEQPRIVFNFVRLALEETGEYRWIDSVTRLGCTHTATNSKLRIISSNGKTAMGLVNVPLAIADEPGSWEIGPSSRGRRCPSGQLQPDPNTGPAGRTRRR